LKIKIYLDTTIISALFDKRTPERMFQTRRFWEHIEEYNVFISELVIDEIITPPEM
jgi:predicted nucleic acid-binding protein